MKAIVLFDANNWYHNVKGWFVPGEIDINKVVDLFSHEKKLEIVEVRWHASVPSIEDDKLKYFRHMDFLTNLRKKGVKVITRKLQRLSTKEIKRKRQELVDSWDLCDKCKPIVDESLLDMTDQHKKEKGIDVWIAVDMIKFSLIEEGCEMCLLISGDADFVPAMELVKQQGKKVLSAFVPKGYSNEIRQKFPFRVLKRVELANCLKIHKSKEK